jgi:hypothetical protein
MALGLPIALIDTTPGWLTVVVASGLLAAVAPARAWYWGVAAGVLIPALSFALRDLEPDPQGLTVCLAGAYLGARTGLYLRSLLDPV